MPQGSTLFLPYKLVAMLAVVAGTAQAEDFRIGSKVYVGEEPVPVSESLTLFSDGVVYDFTESPSQIAVFRKSFDGKKGRFIVLDPAREVRTELSTDQLESFIDQLRELDVSQGDSLLQFSANPKFDTSFDEREGKLRMASREMTYELLTIPAKNDEVAELYREYSDRYTRLGAILERSGVLPFPRLAVNAALGEHERIPYEVQLLIPANKNHKEDLVIRSEHRIQWRLSRDDRAKIDEAGNYLVTFPEVSLEEFLRR